MFIETGKNYFILTTTFAFVGSVKDINEKFILLENASLIINYGLIEKSLNDGSFEEIGNIETDIIIPLKCIEFCSLFKAKLPNEAIKTGVEE